MFDDSKVMEEVCNEKIHVPHLCYRFKVSLTDSPAIFKFYDIPVQCCEFFIRDFFFDKTVYHDKKLEIIGIIQCD